MKIGILGGTFDPPHNGHLLIASEALTQLRLDEIWFMPNKIPPHKQDNDISSIQDRVNMIQLAISDHPNFKLETIELEREGPSYTYDTIKILKKRHPNAEFFFIIGGDMVEYLPKWYKIDDLLTMVTFVGVRRPGYSFSTPYSIKEIYSPQFDVSSTMLRKRFKEGKNTRYLLPDQVKKYVEEKNLYGER
jgi:nicotinate-nucleotide adenylyltransferase